MKMISSTDNFSRTLTVMLHAPFPEWRPRVSAGSLWGANGTTAMAAPFVFDFYAFLTLGPLGVSSMT